MKRKMLISIALITIMLLNCMMPILANATEGEEIMLNSKLYYAVRESLEMQGITFSANDITYTLTLSSSAKSSVKELNLNESSISDLSGLEAFTELTHLELSGNNLTRRSNLGVLNGLSKLNYLDLSTNQLENVSEISELINRLQSSGTIILSGQNVNLVEKVYVDSEENSDNKEKASFELPEILGLAGYIKSCWKSTNSIKETDDVEAPSLNIDSVPMYVTPENNRIEINISGEGGTPGYLGLLELTIYIYDDATEAASAKNPNRAAENILNGSKFNLYYVVHDKSSEAITTMDTNLYNAIKSQLTAGQTKNSALESYPYSVDSNGNVIYDEFTYTTNGDMRTLTNTKTNTIEYKYDYKSNVLRKYSNNAIVNLPVEETIITTISSNGTISSRQGYKIPFVGKEANKTLYIQAYDKAKTFVIDDSVLTNKITSLMLNNEQIRDLSGIEDFVGLSSKLNVSHNYLENIEPIYYMDGQKDIWESQIISKYVQYLKTRSYGNLADAMKKIKEQKAIIDTNSEEIIKATANIMKLLEDAAAVDTTKENYKNDLDSIAGSIEGILKTIYGSRKEDGTYEPGYKNLIDGYEDKAGAVSDLSSSINQMYNYLEYLYVVFNKEYKITTLLVPNINYITYDEYETYVNATKESAESAKALVTEEIDFLKTLEAEKALSDLDKELLTKAFGINFNTDKADAKPLAEYFDEFLKDNALSRTKCVELLNTFREINLYSEMANYCLIKRMNEDTTSGYCYEIEYLENRIKECEEENIPSNLETETLEKLQNNKSETNTLYSIYLAYTAKNYTYGSKTIYACKDKYTKVKSILVEYEKNGTIDSTNSNVSYVLGKLGNTNVNNIINDIKIYETIEGNNKGTAGNLFLFNQVSSLANKLLNGDVERYVKLPRLKDLDISYNAELYDIERISELTNLRDLNASYCYIADLRDIDWTAMKNLKTLSLAYNYISDISSIINVPNLKSLDLSNNLISGKLNINEQQYMKLFKKMEDFNLSGNQITDIENLLIYLDYVSNGNYANYLAREDTLNINLNNQKINLVINDPISLSSYPTTIDVELPKIFSQLLAIDVARTGFGETSQNGRVESEGKYVTLNTRTSGDKQGKVVVLAMSGNGEKVDTCIGNGTTATINYKVQATNPSDPGNVVIPGNNTTKPDNTTNTEKPENNTTKPDNTTNTEKPDNNTNTDNTTNTVDPDPDSKVINTNDLGYEVGEEYLEGVAAKTPVEDFKEILLNGLQYTVVVTKDDDTITSGNMATGMYVKIVDENGNVVKDQNGDLVVYQVVVKGDVNGDGSADSLDSNLIKAYRVEVIDLEGAEFEAADINNDGKVDVSDSKLLLYHRAEVNGYDLNYSKK